MNRTSFGALVQRHRLAFSLCGVVASSAVILPACGGPSHISLPGVNIPTSMAIIVTSTPGVGIVSVGATREYRMEIRDELNAIMYSYTVATWTIVGDPAVATILLTGSALNGNSRGLATCLSAGTVTVHATRAGTANLSADVTLQCNAPSDLAASMTIAVTSTPSTGHVLVGATRQHAIEVRNAGNAIIPGLTSAAWSIVGASGIATITASGGLTTCLRDGSVTVHAIGPVNVNGINLTADASLQCGPPPAVATTMTLRVTSAPTTGTVLTGATRQYAIEVRDQTNVVIPTFTTATWSIVGSTGIATITQAGLASCVTAGSVTVHAIGPTGPAGTNLVADAPLQCVAPLGNVAARIVLTPWTVTAQQGGTATTTASFLDAGGLPTTNGCVVTFTVDAGAAAPIGTVSSSGLTATVSGSTAGRTGLRASCATGGTLPAIARLQVTQAPLHVARIEFATRFHQFPTSGTESSFRFVPRALNASGTEVFGQAVTFTATITNAGPGGAPQVTTDQMGNLSVGATAASAVGPALRGGGKLTASSGGQTEVAFFTFGNAGTLRGQATSALGQYLGGSTVRATNAVTGVPVVGDWDGDGFFYFVGLPSGTYTITVTPVNDPPTTIMNVVVTAGQETVVIVPPFSAIREGK